MANFDVSLLPKEFKKTEQKYDFGCYQEFSPCDFERLFNQFQIMQKSDNQDEFIKDWCSCMIDVAKQQIEAKGKKVYGFSDPQLWYSDRGLSSDGLRLESINFNISFNNANS
jgi:hypothetical protein